MKTFVSSILAGIMIAIGALVFLKTPNPIGAFLFSIGLVTILEFDFHLFTGKIAYVSKIKDLKNILLIIIGNIVGCFPMLFFDVKEQASTVLINKFAISLPHVLISAIICGILIYVAVEGFKKGNLILTILSVATFILCGAEHSIADMCFVFGAYGFSWYSLLFIIIVMIGNAIGSIGFHHLRGYINEQIRRNN